MSHSAWVQGAFGKGECKRTNQSLIVKDMECFTNDFGKGGLSKAGKQGGSVNSLKIAGPRVRVVRREASLEVTEIK